MGALHIKKGQAKGYFLEEIVRKLMQKTNFVNVKTGNIPGRAADHQIDSYGTLMLNLPFVYPVRLISEVKWLDKRVQLHHMRSFVGVVTDISQNYFVPRIMRSRSRNQYIPFPKERYTECGAFFSASGFTTQAQDFAWAYGIYLISFSQEQLLKPILTRAEEILDENPSWKNKGSSKEDIGELARTSIQNDRSLSKQVREIFPYIGIIDQVYPVFIVSNKSFMFSPQTPDDLSVEGNDPFETNNAIKDRRIEDDADVNFQFTFNEINFSFTLPKITAVNIIKSIEGTYKGEIFGSLDVPITLRANQGTYRRMFRINLALPDKTRFISELKRRP